MEPKAVAALQRLIDKELDNRVKRRAMEAAQKIQAGREASTAFQRLRDDVDKLREENRQLKEQLNRIEASKEKPARKS